MAERTLTPRQFANRLSALLREVPDGCSAWCMDGHMLVAPPSISEAAVKLGLHGLSLDQRDELIDAGEVTDCGGW